jgi:uncharacterized protein (TIGR02466 family)
MVMEIKDIFPTPIGFSFNKDYLEYEHNLLLNQEYHYHQTYDMNISKEKFILNTGVVPMIKKFIEAELREYAIKTLGTTQRLRFTQSWCTKHQLPSDKTFPHIHQNSIVSGCYYISANETNEGITFYKNTDYTDRYITWETDPQLMHQYHWNWRWCKFPVKTGLLILFPSQLKHSVNSAAIANNLRCSLAFNTWFEGNIGNQHDLSML